MTVMFSRMALAAVLLCASCATKNTLPPYTPAKAEYAQALPRPIVLRAALGYPGDMETLTKAGGILLGWVTRAEGVDAAIDAASLGGSHLVFVDESTSCTGWKYCSAVTRDRFAVVRIDSSHWAELPQVLKPHAPPTVLLAAGCRCARDFGNDSEWFVRCEGKRPKIEQKELQTLCGG